MATPRREVRVAAAALAVVAALGACAHQAAAEPGGPVAFVTTDPHGGDAALLEGTVEAGESCVVVVGQDGTRYLPVFYSGIAAGDADALTWEGRTYRDGDAIRLGGSSPGAPTGADYVPDGCEYDAAWNVAT